MNIWFKLFAVFAARFGGMALALTYAPAVLTGHLPYDSLRGAFHIVLAAGIWTIGDIMAKSLPELSDTPTNGRQP